jgi:hypothetical protein
MHMPSERLPIRRTPDRPAATAGRGDQGDDVARAVADHRHRLLAQGREEQLTLLSIAARRAGVRVDDLRIEIILEDLQTLL